jgi:hypothetical protein
MSSIKISLGSFDDRTGGFLLDINTDFDGFYLFLSLKDIVGQTDLLKPLLNPHVKSGIVVIPPTQPYLPGPYKMSFDIQNEAGKSYATIEFDAIVSNMGQVVLEGLTGAHFDNASIVDIGPLGFTLVTKPQANFKTAKKLGSH